MSLTPDQLWSLSPREFILAYRGTEERIKMIGYSFALGFSGGESAKDKGTIRGTSNIINHLRK